MGRIRTPNQKKAYNALNSRLTSYVGQVQSIYDMVSMKMADVAVSSGYDGAAPFSFSDYPEYAEAIKDIQAQFVNEMGTLILRGTSEEWRQSNLIQDLLADKVLKHYRAQVRGKRFKKYYQTNSEALKAFQHRRERGLNLSDKLWNQSAILKGEMETAISTAIEKGMSAITLSKHVSRYLSDYPSLKHDYWEKYAKAADCHDCEYRSIRLARSEINMAYRTAEQERWRQFDFITGYEIKLSGSHPAHDICDSLAGKYPKDFKWTGWHPNDMCYAIPIIMSEDEYWSEDREQSEEMIADVPRSYKDWIAENVNRISSADNNGTLPYFLKDNPDFRKYMGTGYVADWRHRTRNADEIQLAWDNRQAMVECGDNLRLLSLRQHAHYIGFDISDFELFIRTTDLKYTKYGDSKLFDDAYDKIQKEYYEARTAINASYKRLVDLRDNIKRCTGAWRSQEALDEIEQVISGYSTFDASSLRTFKKKEFDAVFSSARKKQNETVKKAINANEIELEKSCNVKKGHPMSFKDADEGKGNINYATGGDAYHENCQTCVVVDELRRRGFDVTAVGYSDETITKALSYNDALAWLEKDTGHNPRIMHVSTIGKTDKEVYESLDAATKAKGRYNISVQWNGRDWGHIVRLERRSNGSLRYYDPQNGKEYDIMYLISKMDKKKLISYLKVDDLLADPDIIRQIVKPLKK